MIVWHSENDSSAVSQAFQSLYWRDGDNFWRVINLLLEQEDQRVIDFASQALEQAEISEDQPYQDDIFERVRAMLVNLLGVEPSDVSPNSRIVEDLRADSLDLVEIIMTMEEEFSTDDRPVEISDEEAVEIHSVRDIVDYLNGILV